MRLKGRKGGRPPPAKIGDEIGELGKIFGCPLPGKIWSVR